MVKACFHVTIQKQPWTGNASSRTRTLKKTASLICPVWAFVPYHFNNLSTPNISYFTPIINHTNHRKTPLLLQPLLAPVQWVRADAKRSSQGLSKLSGCHDFPPSSGERAVRAACPGGPWCNHFTDAQQASFFVLLVCCREDEKRNERKESGVVCRSFLVSFSTCFFQRAQSASISSKMINALVLGWDGARW